MSNFITAPPPARGVSAAILADPGAGAVAIIEAFGDMSGGCGNEALTSRVREDTQAVLAGDVTPCEAMLVGQAMALQAMFVNLARRAGGPDTRSLASTDVHLRLALKAQSQCRASLLALSRTRASAQDENHAERTKETLR